MIKHIVVTNYPAQKDWPALPFYLLSHGYQWKQRKANIYPHSFVWCIAVKKKKTRTKRTSLLCVWGRQGSERTELSQLMYLVSLAVTKIN